MSDTERFYKKLQEYFPNAKNWEQLHPNDQMQVVWGINAILGVMQR